MFDAWHLPGTSAAELTLTSHQFGDLDLRAPQLTTDQLSRALQHIRRKRKRLIDSTTADIIDAIDAAAAQLADPDSEAGAAARTLLPAVTGYSTPVIEDILQHMTSDWSRASLMQLVMSEFGDAAALDHAAARENASGFTFARGPALAYQVFSGNVPGVAVTAMIRCMLVKAAQLGKTAAGEPVLPILFVRALAHVAPQLAECIALSYWPGGRADVEGVALDEADTVIVYGGEDTVRSVQGRKHSGKRIVVHGPKLSIGVVGRAATIDVAPDIAYAAAAYDQQGCVSPHVIFIEQGGAVAPKELARAIATALAALAVTYPRRTVDAAEAIAIRAARANAEFHAIAGGDSEVYASSDTSYTVIYDDNAALMTSCLNRTLYVKSIERAEALYSLLHPHRGIMQSAAIAGFSANQAKAIGVMLADCGVTRVTTFKCLPWPPMWWHHDGAGPLRELLMWHDVET